MMKRKLRAYYVNGGYVVDMKEEVDRDGEPVVVAWYRKMPQCLAQGASRAEAMEHLEQIRAAFIESRLKRGVEVPEPDFPAPANHRIVISSQHGGGATTGSSNHTASATLKYWWETDARPVAL